MESLVGILAAAAVAAWVTMFVTGIRLLGRRSGRLSLSALMVRGIAWFDARNFQPEAAGLHRTFMLAFGSFFAFLVAAAIVAVVSGTWQRP